MNREQAEKLCGEDHRPRRPSWVFLNPTDYEALCDSLEIPLDERESAWLPPTQPYDSVFTVKFDGVNDYLSGSRVATEYATAQVNPYEEKHDTDRPPVTKLCYYCGQEPVHVVKHDQPACCPSCARRAQRPRKV